MKKKHTIIIIVSILVFFTSCANKKVYYNVSEQEILMNYNNISTKTPSPWIDEDCVLFSRHDFFFNAYMINEKGMMKIGNMAHGSSIQKYDNMAYWFTGSEKDNEMQLIGYDTVSNKRENIVTVFAENVVQFLISGEILYVITSASVDGSEKLMRTLQAVSMENNESVTIAQDVISVGVVDGSIHYLAISAEAYELRQYDIKTQTNIVIGSFQVDAEEEEPLFRLSSVNFTSAYLFFLVDHQTPTIYDIETNCLRQFEPMNGFCNIVAFETYAFMTEEKDDSEVTLFHISLELGNMKEVARFAADTVGLFVTSEHDAYISYGENIMHCTSEGDKNLILRVDV